MWIRLQHGKGRKLCVWGSAIFIFYFTATQIVIYELFVSNFWWNSYKNWVWVFRNFQGNLTYKHKMSELVSLNRLYTSFCFNFSVGHLQLEVLSYVSSRQAGKKNEIKTDSSPWIIWSTLPGLSNLRSR